MVSAIALMGEIDKLTANIYKEETLADKDRLAEYHATNIIKACYRGYMTRKKLFDMHLKANVIQRFWRGFLGRRRFRSKLNERVEELALEYFNKTATRIQSCWRGYYTRKYVADYYQRKLRLKALDETNEEIRKTLACYAEQMKQQNEQDNESNKAEANSLWASTHHYLLSTEVQFGVYNSPYLPEPQPEEHLLRAAKPRVPPPQDLKKHKREDKIWRSYNEPLPVPFPTLPPVKPQGPFRAPDSVLKQRTKPLEPTLRVETDYDSVEQARRDLIAEEWLGRVHDDPFIYFYNMKEPHVPHIWTKSDFRKLKYGSVKFRDDTGITPAMQQRVKNGFRTILPPIPIFEKFGETYSQGQV